MLINPRIHAHLAKCRRLLYAGVVFPYVPTPVIVVGGRIVTAFQILFVVAIGIGTILFHRRARRCGIPRRDRWGFFVCLLGLGFVGATLVKAVGVTLASGVALQRRGIASMGGFGGGFVGGALFCLFRRYNRPQLFAMLDSMAYAAPFAWLPGRLGCALAHDHAGLFTENWLGVQFREGTRYDLGLVEFLFLIPLCMAFWWLGRKPRPAGFFFALFGCVYGGFRLWLETLHEQHYRFIAASIMMAIGISGWLTRPHLPVKKDSVSTPQFT